jgi:hypothetical protein
MKTLSEIQTALQDFLLDKTQDASDLTLETPAFSKLERLGIYHNAYRLRLIDALRNDYPALEAYLGDDNFTTLCNEFIAQNPSQHPSLRWFGEHLPSFLRTHTYWQHLIVVVELAEFEWFQAMAFDAADTEITTLDHVRALNPEQWMQMQLKFHPSLQIITCFSNAPELWNSLIKSGIAIEVATTTELQAWLIWRENLQVVYRPLDSAEYWALTTFQDQNNFTEVCSGLCEWFAEEQVPMHAAQYLQQWIRAGLVVGIITDEYNT